YTMTTFPRSHCACRASAFIAVVSFLIVVCTGWAQNTATGTIEGRVFNPLTKEYLRNAEVRIQGTSILAVTGNDGSYRIPNVPVGVATVSVSYTGYQPMSAEVTVPPRQVVTHNFDLQSTAGVESGGVVALDRFTVSSRREGTAKAIMEQRTAMTVKNVIASDTFGD